MADLKITQEALLTSMSGAELIRVATTNSTSSVTASNYAVPASLWPAGAFAVVGNTFATATSYISGESLSISATGGLSAGIVGGALVLSAITTAATSSSQPLLSLYATSNTTAALNAETVQGALTVAGYGGVSVGFSSGSLLISGVTGGGSSGTSTYQVIGNTLTADNNTGSASGTLLISGTGALSVGMSSNTLIISGATVAAGGSTFSAVGNVTGGTTTQTTSNSLTISGAGGASVGFSSSTLIISAPTTVASATGEAWTAVGNTAGTIAGATLTLTSKTITAGGIISAGFNAGSLVLSATTAASGTVLNLLASSNTTGVSSTTSVTLTNWSISGAGGVSVGFSTSAAGAPYLVISGATTIASATNENFSAVGANTVGQSSSSTLSQTAKAFSGSGIVSVGASAGTVQIAATTSQSVQTLSISALGNVLANGTTTTFNPTAISLSGAGIVSVGVSGSTISISASSAASATSMGLSAAGSTTGQSSSTSANLTGLTFAGSGAASVGYSAGSIIISAPSPGAATLSVYASSNTIGGDNTSTTMGGAFTVSADGGLSAGLTGGTIVLSGATGGGGGTSNISAIGNVTGGTTSQTTGTSLTVSGAGGASVGWSSSTFVVSAPSVSSLVAGGGITLSTSSNTITISGAVSAASQSFAEPAQWINTSVMALPTGTMAVATLTGNADYLIVNQFRMLASRAVVNPIAGVTSRGTGTTRSAACTWGSTLTLALYSQQSSTNFLSFSTATTSSVVWSQLATFSVSMSNTSLTVSQTLQLNWPSGTGSSSSSMSITSALSTAGSSTIQIANASTSNFSAWLRQDIPFAATISNGVWLVGLLGTTGSTGTGSASLSLTAGSWSGSTMAMTQASALTFNLPGVVSATSTAAFPGIGSTSSAAGAMPATIAWQSISSGPQFYFHAGML